MGKMTRFLALTNFIQYGLQPYLRIGDKKPINIQIQEMWRLYGTYRYFPYQYLRTGLYTREASEPVEDFVPPRIIYDYAATLNPQAAQLVVRDKRLFRERLEAAGLPVVRELVVVDDRGTIRDGAGRELDAAAALALLREHGRDVFVKPVDGTLGRGTFVQPVGDLDAGFFARHRNVLVQPRIEQHPALAALYPHAVNTVRIDTLLTEEGFVHNAAVLKLGVGGAVVDNGAAGGMIVGLDLETGRLRPRARQQPKFGAQWHAYHPDTGVSLGGLTVPHWDLVRATVIRAAEVLRPLGSLGWDVAITTEGVVLIEANHRWGVNIMQIGWGGLGRTEIGRRALAYRIGAV